MYEAEKQEYQRMKRAIDKNTLRLDKKAIEIGKAVNEAHRMVGEREDLIAIYEAKTGLKYDKDHAVDIERLLDMKKKHEDEINETPVKVEKEPVPKPTPTKRYTAPDLGTAIWSVALLPLAITEESLSPSTVSSAVVYAAADRPEDEINLVFHYEGNMREEEITRQAQETLENAPETYLAAVIPEGKKIRLKGIRDEETGSLEKFLVGMANTTLEPDPEEAPQPEREKINTETEAKAPATATRPPSVISR